jgi:hypothetical protein
MRCVRREGEDEVCEEGGVRSGPQRHQQSLVKNKQRLPEQHAH